MMKIIPHKAKYGDCVQISWEDSFGKERNIVIDGGPRSSYEEGIKIAVEGILKGNDKQVDLLILTHYDSDHIGGILKLFADDTLDCQRIKKVLFNSKKLVKNKPLTDWEFQFEEIEGIDTEKLGFGDLVTLTKVLEQKKMTVNETPMSRQNTPELMIDNLKIQIITPSNEELKELFDSEPNFPASDESVQELTIEEYSKLPDSSEDKIVHGASLSFVFELDSKRFLYLSDTTSSSYIKGLLEREDENFKFDLIKLSHHGSKYNINSDFISRIKCTRFLICTSGTRYGHPHKVVIAKIAASNKTKGIASEFLMNYPIHNGWFENERKTYCLSFDTVNEITL